MTEVTTALDVTMPVYRLDPDANATHYVFHATKDVEVYEYAIPAPGGVVKRGEITPIESVTRLEDSMMANHDHPDKKMHGKTQVPYTAKRSAEDFVDIKRNRGAVILKELTGLPRADVKAIYLALLSEKPKVFGDWIAYLRGKEVADKIEALPEKLREPARATLERIVASVEAGRDYVLNQLADVADDYNNNSTQITTRKSLFKPEREAYESLGIAPPAAFREKAAKDDKAELAALVGAAVAEAIAGRLGPQVDTEKEMLKKRIAELEAQRAPQNQGNGGRK